MKAEQRDSIMNGLSLLTGDKLQYNSKTGAIDIIQRANDKKNKLPAGTALIRALVGDKNHVATITWAGDQN
jgi:hypothetical protein